MRIAVDLACLTPHRVSGIGVYAAQVSKALAQVGQSRGHTVEGWIPMRKIGRLEEVVGRALVPINTWNEITRWTNPPDVLHGLDFKVPRWGRFKKVVTVHDLVEFEEAYNSPEFIERAKKNFRHMLLRNKPDHIISISDFTTEKIRQFFPDLDIPITRIYHGVDHRPLSCERADRLFQHPYILSVGTLEKRKNQIRLVEAFDLLRPQLKNLKLVLAGSVGFEGRQVQQRIEKSPYFADIHHLPHLNDEELASLYQHAEAMVLPTLYEGFGLPVLEAMRMRTPVVTSKSGAVSEISSDCALKIDPQNSEELAQGILKILSMPTDEKKKFIEQAFQHSQKFTWANTATQTLNLDESLLR